MANRKTADFVFLALSKPFRKQTYSENRSAFLPVIAYKSFLINQFCIIRNPRLPRVFNSGYSKNGTLGVAYFFNASKLSSAPVPGLPDTVRKPFSINGL